MGSEPLVVLGLVSAAPYRGRRDLARETWMSRAPDEALVRFVVALHSTAEPQFGASLQGELHSNGDLVVIATSVPPSRLLSPLDTTFRWFKYASEHYSRARFVAKCDDDTYIVVEELVQQLKLLGTHQNVYFGRVYWTTWDSQNYVHGISKFSPNAHHSCKYKLSLCTGPFPFTTGSLQLISQDLTQRLAYSVPAQKHLDTIISELANESSPVAWRRHQLYRNQPVYEDVWLGYALYELLPRDKPARITLVGLNYKAYTYDDWGYLVRNSSMILHWKLKSKSPASGNSSSLARRMMLTHAYVLKNHCPSLPQFKCKPFSPAMVKSSHALMASAYASAMAANSTSTLSGSLLRTSLAQLPKPRIWQGSLCNIDPTRTSCRQ
jgi:hypothetical protein